MPLIIPGGSPASQGPTTPLQLINRAAELIGYKDPDETLSSAEQTSFLGVMNDMLDGWNTQRLFIVNIGEIVVTVSGLPINIGPGATINVDRPINMEAGSFIRHNGSDYGIKWIGQEEYNAYLVKSVAGVLSYVGYYQQSVPVGSIYLWPYPASPVELHLQVQQQLIQFSDLVTGYSMAPGYRKAIAYSLAEELAPGRRTLDPNIARIAASARKAIRRTNVDQPLQSLSPSAASPYAAFISGL